MSTMPENQAMALQTLYENAGNIFGNSASDRSKYQSLRSSITTWGINCYYGRLHWRQAIADRIWSLAHTFDPAAFRNMNEVRPQSLWPAMYSNRVLALRNAMFAIARDSDVAGLGIKLKIGSGSGSGKSELLPPGIYTAQISSVACSGKKMQVTVKVNGEICGKRPEFVICDDIHGAITGRWSSGMIDEERQDKEIIAMMKNVKTVKVQYQQDQATSRTYDFLTDDNSIEKGDLVVVETNGSTNIVKVLDVNVGISDKANKWVVQKIDFTGYKERLEKIAKAKELKRILDAAVERKRNMIDYEAILGDGDEDLKKILAEFKELQS